ncbi:unnamed protein product [Amoebophrya sp. A120]|nr:unnamed protein product [Amoebophrya sp. A120]|eukprot:GSA120T00017630001.1
MNKSALAALDKRDHVDPSSKLSLPEQGRPLYVLGAAASFCKEPIKPTLEFSFENPECRLHLYRVKVASHGIRPTWPTDEMLVYLDSDQGDFLLDVHEYIDQKSGKFKVFAQGEFWIVEKLCFPGEDDEMGVEQNGENKEGKNGGSTNSTSASASSASNERPNNYVEMKQRLPPPENKTTEEDSATTVSLLTFTLDVVTKIVDNRPGFTRGHKVFLNPSLQERRNQSASGYFLTFSRPRSEPGPVSSIGDGDSTWLAESDEEEFEDMKEVIDEPLVHATYFENIVDIFKEGLKGPGTSAAGTSVGNNLTAFDQANANALAGANREQLAGMLKAGGARSPAPSSSAGDPSFAALSPTTSREEPANIHRAGNNHQQVFPAAGGPSRATGEESTRTTAQTSSVQDNMKKDSFILQPLQKAMSTPHNLAFHPDSRGRIGSPKADQFSGTQSPDSDHNASNVLSRSGYAAPPRAPGQMKPGQHQQQADRIYFAPSVDKIEGLRRKPDLLVEINPDAVKDKRVLVDRIHKSTIAIEGGTIKASHLKNIQPVLPNDLPEDLKAAIVNPFDFEAVPIIDYSLPREKLLPLLGKAAKEIGFFYLVNHSVEPELMDAVFKNAQVFFDLSQKTKEKYLMNQSEAMTGYFGKGMENLDEVYDEGEGALRIPTETSKEVVGATSDRVVYAGTTGTNDEDTTTASQDKPNANPVKDVNPQEQVLPPVARQDCKEGFDMNGNTAGSRSAANLKAASSGRWLEESDMPDKEVPGFTPVMRRYQEQVLDLSLKLMELLGTACDLKVKTSVIHADRHTRSTGGLQNNSNRADGSTSSSKSRSTPPPRFEDSQKVLAEGDHEVEQEVEDDAHYDDQVLRRSCDNAVCHHRILHYPPLQDYHNEVSIGAHVDYGFLTMLAQDMVGGLQVLNAKRHAWIHVPPIKHAFVVNFGSMLAQWTRHKIKATIHRVVNLSTAERYSSPFFFRPSLTTVLDPRVFDKERKKDVDDDDEPALTCEQTLMHFYTKSGQAKEGKKK